MVFDVNARDRGLLGRTLRVPTSYWGAGYVAKAQKKYKTDKMTGVVKKLLAGLRTGQHRPTQAGGAHPYLVQGVRPGHVLARLLQRLPQPAHQAPLHRHAPVAKKLLVGVVLTSTRTGGRKEYKKKAQS
eukprot:jgi/Mesvir1/2137/Mv16659-RA.1